MAVQPALLRYLGASSTCGSYRGTIRASMHLNRGSGDALEFSCDLGDGK
jgi:hypothetical protein